MSAATVLYQGERYTVELDTACPVVGRPCEGLVYYGLGTIAVRSATAPAWAPSVVELLPEGGNGVYLCLSADVAGWAGAFYVVSRWLISQGYRDESGRITETGRAALYGS